MSKLILVVTNIALKFIDDDYKHAINEILNKN